MFNKKNPMRYFSGSTFVRLPLYKLAAGGTAVAKCQSVAEGTKVSKGTVIKVNFLYSDTNDSTAVG